MTDVKNIGPIPQIGYGTWNRSGDEAYNGVMAALDIGYRHIDTAEGYNNEEFVGKAIADSPVARDDIFLTTKVAPESFAPGQIRGHVEASLKKLRTDQVDMLLLHYPAINDEYDIEDYVGQLAAIYDAGLTKSIGVSNFTIRHLSRAIELLGDRPIATNQCEIHVYLQNHPIVDFTKSKSISMTAYSPLARGAVADDELLNAIGKGHDASASQIALAFLMAEGHIVIPSSGNAKRNAENFAAKDIELSAKEVVQIRGLEKNMRLVNGPWCPKWDE
ncbi:MAG: aldo/keto reductase [Roseibium sp.]